MIKNQVKSISLCHPETGWPVMAEVVGYVMANGRTVGCKLRIKGEQQVRPMLFGEIRQLQRVGKNDSQ